MGVKVYKAPYVYGTPIEYYQSTTGQTFAINSLAKMGSTGGGKLDYADGSTNFTNGLFLVLKATTGNSAEMIPVTRVLRDVTYIVDCATSDTVASTTNVGNCISISSSGGALPGTTGGFKVSAIYNTSSNLAEKFAGNFMMIAATTN